MIYGAQRPRPKRPRTCCHVRPAMSLGGRAALPLSRPRRVRAQTKLPSSQKAERIGPKDASASEAGTAVRSSGQSRCKRRGDACTDPRHRRSGFRGRRVRSTPVSSAAARQERADRLRRDRAAAQALRSAFPSVQQLRLDMRFEGSAANTPTPQSHVLYPPARAFFAFPCPYADCDGQFDLTEAVNTALADPSHRTEGVLQCSGARVGDRASRQPCLLRLLHSITATYHQGS
jgi:hypothetical protein